jgi:hypothetical protein
MTSVVLNCLAWLLRVVGGVVCFVGGRHGLMVGYGLSGGCSASSNTHYSLLG